MSEQRDKFTIVTLHERPGINETFYKQKERIWPEFMFRDVYADTLWSYVYTTFQEYQLYLCSHTN